MRGSTSGIGAGIFGGTEGVAVSCGELGATGLINLEECCAVCHSADGFSVGGAAALGPCHTMLADGRAALVCCAARKHVGGR